MHPSQFRVGGKLPPRRDSRTLKLARFLRTSELPAPPLALSYGAKVNPWGMYANDKLGDCTIAGAAHHIELWGALEGQKTTPSQRTITSVYKKLSPNDEGCVLLDVMNYWRHTGIAGHKLFAFAALDQKNHEHVKLSLSLFGGVYLGVALPNAWQDTVGKVWDAPKDGVLTGKWRRNSWGGHCIVKVGYNATGPIVVTWGALQQMTWAGWDTYCDEAYCLLTADYQRAPKISGIDFPALQAALGQVGKVAA